MAIRVSQSLRFFLMSLRWRCAPAGGSIVAFFRFSYPALIPQRGFSLKSFAPRERTGLDCVASAALCVWAALKMRERQCRYILARYHHEKKPAIQGKPALGDWRKYESERQDAAFVRTGSSSLSKKT